MTPPFVHLLATFLGLVVLTGSNAAGDEFAVFKSSDRGRSWTRSDTGLPRQFRINAFASADRALVVATDSGMFTSRDEALSWQPVTGTAASSGRVISLAASGPRVFAGSAGNGLLRSVDGGGSWVQDAAFPAKKVRCLITHGGKVYAGTDAEGVFTGESDAQTWTRLGPGFPANAQVFAMAVIGDSLFAGLYSRGLYVWDESDPRWMKRGPVRPLALAVIDGALIVGHNPGGIHWSDDKGATWSKGIANGPVGGEFAPLTSIDSGDLPAEAPVWDLSFNNGSAFAGASKGIYFSEDRGHTWTRARGGLPEESPGIAFLVTKDFVLAAVGINKSRGEPIALGEEREAVRPAAGQ